MSRTDLRGEHGKERECPGHLECRSPCWAHTNKPSRSISVCGLTFQVLHVSAWQQSPIFPGKCGIIQEGPRAKTKNQQQTPKTLSEMSYQNSGRACSSPVYLSPTLWKVPPLREPHRNQQLPQDPVNIPLPNPDSDWSECQSHSHSDTALEDACEDQALCPCSAETHPSILPHQLHTFMLTVKAYSQRELGTSAPSSVLLVQPKLGTLLFLAFEKLCVPGRQPTFYKNKNKNKNPSQTQSW